MGEEKYFQMRELFKKEIFVKYVYRTMNTQVFKWFAEQHFFYAVLSLILLANNCLMK